MICKKEEVSYKSKQQKAYSTVERHQFSEQDSDSDVVALVVHEKALSSADKNVGWIIDSGATCHMCNDVNAFTECVTLKQPQEISLGDGHIVKATGKASLIGSLYQLNVIDGKETVSAAVTDSNEVLWHRRYGHVGFKALDFL
eukprot:gene3830-4363_t